MDVFTDEDIEQLIDLVSKQRDLYDPTTREFKSIHRRQAIWLDIANTLNKDSAACKIQWKKLRDRYRHFKKTNIVITDSSPAKWKQCQLMTFLDIDKQKVSARNTDTATSNACSASDSDRNGQTCTYVPPNEPSTSRTRNIEDFKEVLQIYKHIITTKQKFHANSDGHLRPQKEEKEVINDEFSSFTLHIRDVLRKLPQPLQINAKNEIFQVLSKYEALACDSSSSDMSVSNNTSTCSTPLPDLSWKEMNSFRHPQPVQSEENQIQWGYDSGINFNDLIKMTHE
ncbi:transcription factor Adf-1-like [Spodoptera litura]|uniref:Transcription factor Adf-1-like n=1 Tax=Spodoptera litura TaxID=69820 RepID=A0A9J7DNN2_SPOLT|nr:transcription factor Adf-1-like [Spodoptera litura]